jgi:replicative DNA helicase
METDLPHNTELEREVVVALFASAGDTRAEIQANCRPDFFHSENLRQLFVEGAAEDAPGLMVAYDRAWTIRGDALQNSFSRSDLKFRVDACPRDYKVIQAIDQLRKLANRRYAISEGRRIAASGMDGDVDLVSIGSSFSDRSLSTLVKNYDDSVQEVHGEILRQAVSGLNEEERIGFGFKRLDEVLRGFRREDFLVLGGEPNVGKSPLGLELALRRARLGYGHQIIFTLEMSKRQVVQELVAMDSGVPLDALTFGLKQEQQSEGLKRIDDSMAWINDSFSIIERAYTPEYIRSVCAKKRSDLARRGKALDCRMFDYLQLLGQGNEELTRWTRFFKEDALRERCPWIVISSMNREYEKRRGQIEDGYCIPNKSDLRDCGNIEYDATKIMFLLHWLRESTPTPDRRVLYVSKNKFGPASRAVKMGFKYETLNFFEEEK